MSSEIELSRIETSISKLLEEQSQLISSIKANRTNTQTEIERLVREMELQGNGLELRLSKVVSEIEHNMRELQMARTRMQRENTSKTDTPRPRYRL